jgi:AcrR family transcriptional regulator
MIMNGVGPGHYSHSPPDWQPQDKMLKLGTKKPKQARSQGTVEAILEAVTRIMDAEGLVGLTTNKIAEKAGVSVGSLYQYFKNKESIFEAILLRMTEDNLRSLETTLAAGPENRGIRQVVELVVRGHYANVKKLGKLSSVLFQIAPQILSVNHFKKSDEQIVRFLLQRLDTDRISIRPKNREAAFFICSQTVRGVLFMAFLQKEEPERDLIIEELIDLLVRYLEDDTRAATPAP